MTPRTALLPWRELIPSAALVASERFGPRLPASRVAAAIGAGLTLGAAQPPDLCPLAPPDRESGLSSAGGALSSAGGALSSGSEAVSSVGEAVSSAGALLERLDFDARLLDARALVIAVPAVDPQDLQQTLAFEIATRARQRGIPAYAVLARPTLEPFDARILDLQIVLLARDEPELELAGTRLASLI